MTMTGEMAVMSRTEGDTKIIWDKDNPEEVAAAKAMFDDLVGVKKFQAFLVGKKGRAGELIRRFDPNAEKLILTPPMVGG